MKREACVLLTTVWLALATVSAFATTASAPATLKAIKASASPSGGELVLRMEGGYSFKTVQATDQTLFIDLKGAKLGNVPKTARWSGGLLTGYRLLQYVDSSGEQVLRVQVEMKHLEPYTVQRMEAGLRLLFGQDASSITPAPTPSSTTSTATVPAPMTRVVPTAGVNGPVAVSDVTITNGAAGETFVDVVTTREAPFRVLQLRNPSRVVVDLEGARCAALHRSYAAHSPVLRDVRVGQFRDKDPQVVRVVADLAGEPAFGVHAYRSGVRIELRPRSSTTLRAALPAHAGSAAPTPVLEPSTPRAVTLPVQARVAAPPVESKTELIPQPVNAAVAPPFGKRTVRLRSPSPSEVEGRAVSEAPQRMVQGEVEPQAEVKETPKVSYQGAVPAVAGTQQAVAAPRPAVPSQTPEALKAERASKVLTAQPEANFPQAQTGAASGGATAQPQYTGEPISVNLKDVDLKDFFRLIHEISGLNMLIDPNVTGSVTLVLEAVPWDQALDIVLKDNHLAKSLEGNVLRIGRVETFTAEQEAAAKLAAAREQAAPLVTVFRPVNYAKASTIATILKSWVGGGALTKRGLVLVDDRTNTLIISDIQSQIPIIQSIIDKLDTKTKQIAIEARVVLATSTFTRDIQAALYGVAANSSGSTLGAASVGATTSITPNVTFPGPQGATVASNSALGFGGVAISNAASRYMINAAIAAAETRAQAKTISRPSIVTQNNVAGTVQQGTQIPIQTTINNTISVTYVNATLNLTVTPQVTEDGHIFLNINVTNATPGAVLTSAGPSITTQSASTQVLVPDGGTVVFGGVTVTSRTKTATYVPLIGNIPIIGNLFKNSQVQDSDQELLFFVSPKVLTG
jgi:type IV pilus assembly protein PilQ